ncbi:MAG: dienelactone hydrolase family protein, partial [Rhodobacteraceae bacterium]|nr:dienelactone hydrolase family protein [Paracoccaceae bacterium]
MAARSFSLDAGDGHRLSAFRADPSEKPKAGVIVLHAVYGLTQRMARVCEIWAEAGYAAIAPALFDRLGSDRVYPYTSDAAKTGSADYAALSETQIFADIDAAADALPGPAIISGFCSGGSWAWRAAARPDRFYAAQVNFYGSHIPKLIDLAPRCPTILHYGDGDHVVSLGEIEGIRTRHPGVELHIYPGAGHAFENPEQP